jgi:hypothetical protein
VGNRLFFLVDVSAGQGRTKLYVTDGSAAGTRSLTQVPAPLGDLTAFGGYLYYTGPGAGGTQLFRTDGAAAGTVQLTSYQRLQVEGLFTSGPGPAQGRLYYGVGDGNTNRSPTHLLIFKTDGTSAGTTLVRSLSGSNYAWLNGGLSAAGHVYLIISDGVHGTQLWQEAAPAKAQVLAVGSGTSPIVNVYNAATGRLKFTILAAPANFTGGIRVAVGDVNGDGVDDIITGAGPGGGPVVKVFDGTDGHLIRSYFAFAPTFTGGVFVAAGDVNNDGFADIVAGMGPGAGPHVAVFSGRTGRLFRSFLTDVPTFHGGVTVAAGDTDADGDADVITGAGPGGGPHVEVFDGLTGALVKQFNAFDVNFRGGVTVAAADTNADGNADVIVGAGPGLAAGPAVWLVSGFNLALLQTLTPYDPRFAGGVRVGAADVNGDGRASLVTGPGSGGGPDVRAFGGSASALRFNAFDPTFLGGVWVG